MSSDKRHKIDQQSIKHHQSPYHSSEHSYDDSTAEKKGPLTIHERRAKMSSAEREFLEQADREDAGDPYTDESRAQSREEWDIAHRKYHVYCLIDPRDNSIKWIDSCWQDLENRLQDHRWDQVCFREDRIVKDDAYLEWNFELASQRLYPCMVEMEQTTYETEYQIEQAIKRSAILAVELGWGIPLNTFDDQFAQQLNGYVQARENPTPNTVYAVGHPSRGGGEIVWLGYSKDPAQHVHTRSFKNRYGSQGEAFIGWIDELLASKQDPIVAPLESTPARTLQQWINVFRDEWRVPLLNPQCSLQEMEQQREETRYVWPDDE